MIHMKSILPSCGDFLWTSLLLVSYEIYLDHVNKSQGPLYTLPGMKDKTLPGANNTNDLSIIIQIR